MKKVLKVFIYIVFFIAMVVIFLPKKNIYYYAAKELRSNKITITSKLIEDKAFSLNLLQNDLKYEGLELANVESFDLNSFLIYSTLDINNIKTDSSFSSLLPENIEKIKIYHSIIDPVKLQIRADFDLGECRGEVDLLERKVVLNFKVSKEFESKYYLLVENLKYLEDESNEKGDSYSYEYKY